MRYFKYAMKNMWESVFLKCFIPIFTPWSEVYLITCNSHGKNQLFPIDTKASDFPGRVPVTSPNCRRFQNKDISNKETKSDRAILNSKLSDSSAKSNESWSTNQYFECGSGRAWRVMLLITACSLKKPTNHVEVFQIWRSPSIKPCFAYYFVLFLSPHR